MDYYETRFQPLVYPIPVCKFQSYFLFQVIRMKQSFFTLISPGCGMIDEWRHEAGDTTAATCLGRGQALADWLAEGYTWLWQFKTRNQPLISVLSSASFTVRYLSAYLFVPVDNPTHGNLWCLMLRQLFWRKSKIPTGSCYYHSWVLKSAFTFFLLTLLSVLYLTLCQS
jgi:hypothetical protein